MIQLKIDDNTTDLSTGQWEKSRVGELVHGIYEEIPDTRIITKVLVNGAPLTTQNEGQSVSIEDDTEIEIRTADRLMWEASGVDTCLSILERVQTSLIRTAELFRQDEKARANRFFAQCIESLEKFLDAMTITRMACRIDFNSVQMDGTTLAKVEDALTTILRSVLEVQEKQDYEQLADKIECELITNLYHWKTGLQDVRRARQSNG